MEKSIRNNLSNIYVYVIAFSVIPLLIFTTPTITYTEIGYLLFWIALEIAADLKPFRIIYYQQMEMSMSFAVQLSAIILLGIGPSLWVVIIATLIVEIINKKTWNRILFNAGQYGLSMLVAGYLFHLLKLSSDKVPPLDIIQDFPAILVTVSVYFLLNTFFISAVISLTSNSRFIDVFMSDFKIIASYFLALTPISIAVSLLYSQERPYVILIMIPPMIMADQALRWYYSLNIETQKTLKVLADTVDERDEYTFSHSIHVAEYSKKIAQHLGLSPDEVNEIEIAGQVHDLGKVGIEDGILRKTSKLDDREFEMLKKHPEVAYQLLKNLTPYKKGAKYVLYHHKYFNGGGYPQKIQEKDLPLGARILTVADSYDAMTTDRPYRKALSQVVAVGELRKCSGTQFDPEIVQIFIKILKNDYGYEE